MANKVDDRSAYGRGSTPPYGPEKVARWQPRLLVIVLTVLVTAACSPSVPLAEQQPGLSSPPPTSTTTPIRESASNGEPPTPGTALLADLPSSGRVNVIAGRSGFTVVQSLREIGGDQDMSTASTYDAAGSLLTTLRSGSFSGECGLADVTPGGRRLVITSLVSTTPAQGVQPAQYMQTMTAWDARTGDEVWTTTIVEPQGVDLNVSCSAFGGQLFTRNAASPMISISSDGRWGTLRVFTGTDDLVGAMNLADGRIYERADVLGILGNYVVLGENQSTSAKQEAVIALPPDWLSLGTFPLVSSIYDPGVLLGFSRGSSSEIFTIVSAGSSPTTGTAQSGEILFTYETPPSGYDRLLRAYQLPAMTLLWEKESADSDLQLVAEGGGTLVVKSVNGATSTMLGIDAATGEQRWELPDFAVCGVTSTQLLASANDQLAVIDLARGEQLSFTPGGTSDCPQVLSGGIQHDGPGGGLTQILTP